MTLPPCNDASDAVRTDAEDAAEADADDEDGEEEGDTVDADEEEDEDGNDAADAPAKEDDEDADDETTLNTRGGDGRDERPNPSKSMAITRRCGLACGGSATI